MQDITKLYAVGLDAGKRHGLAEGIKEDSAHSLESMAAYGDCQEAEYIGSRSVVIMFDYYRDKDGRVWYLSSREEKNV